MAMIDRGWRRSGTYMYKPDMRQTCCPQYTIKLDAIQFAPTRSQRQIANRWNRYIVEGSKEENGMEVEKTKSQMSGKSTPPFDLVQAVHAAEASFLPADAPTPAHRFEVWILESSSYTVEKFQLYQRYQKDIHKEEIEKKPANFINFLVETPLQDEPIPYPTPPPDCFPKRYGSYHQCYRLDGELIAVAVLDILPGCVSSVYFMYDKKWEKHSLGKLSALREAALAREIRQAGIGAMHSLYMGFYVHNCPKMRYKGDYSPSYLLDPEEYTWFPFQQCTELLSKHRYACFSRPEIFFDENPGPQEVEDIPPEELQEILVFEMRKMAVAPVMESTYWAKKASRELLLQAIKGLGPDISRRVVLVPT
ncbi:hypothetical protein M422DRAFT_33749 [Sphaerobolus stellatus SS14]|uniref:Arginyl-tRNA--protein transferase 1 n=1 Tax=Sphaerobolus stellatus (strain SS14) TaxID=990650 RepID=A0A0C9URK8_SPHS4|nr:hypothetical protein M422DRAFT_33749 [Sphaerobolus stellatus SS14]